MIISSLEVLFIIRSTDVFSLQIILIFFPRSLSIPNHMKALGPACRGWGGGLLLTSTMEPVGLILVFRGPKGGLPNVPALSTPTPKKAGS